MRLRSLNKVILATTVATSLLVTGCMVHPVSNTQGVEQVLDIIDSITIQKIEASDITDMMLYELTEPPKGVMIASSCIESMNMSIILIKIQI